VSPLAERGQLRNVPETRELAWADAELRMQSSDGGLNFRGYASCFDSAYEIHDQWGTYTETVARSAFDKTLSDGADIVFLINHDGAPLARTKSGTLQVRTDGKGLLTEAHLDRANPRAAELKSMIDRNDLDQMSFTFRDLAPSWNAAYTARSLRSVDLNHGDVSVVNFAANPATAGTIAMRSRIAAAGLRAKYKQADRDRMAKSGAAMSDGSYPIADAEDLGNAIHAVGRGGADHDAIRRHIIKRAKALGLSSKIPDNWNSDGSLRQSNAAGRLGERRSSLHANVSGSHSHRHPANQSQGSWKTHVHQHSHSGDSNHVHDHNALDDAAADADAATSQTQNPADSLAFGDFDLEARVRIAKAKVQLADASPGLTLGERWALGLYADLEGRLARRQAEAAALHAPVTGIHAHPHPAYGSQGGDASHSHQHEHEHDSRHDHHGPGEPDAANVGAKVNKIANTKKVGGK